jgi:hypothetical protein
MAEHAGISANLHGLPVTALQKKNSRIYTGVVVALFVVSSLMVTTRIVSRWRSRSRVAVDEYFIIAAAVSDARLARRTFHHSSSVPDHVELSANKRSMTALRQILGLIDMALIIATVSPILTFHREFLPFDSIAKVAPLTMVAEIATSWSVALVKTSIALMLVRLQQSRAWTHFLYTVIGVQVVTAVLVTIMHTTRCIPIEAIWNPTITDKWCWSPEAFKVTMTVASALVIATDVVFSLIPLTFLHHIRRSIPHRVVIAILMSLGLVASAASAVKTVMVYQYDQTGDPSGSGMAIALWASIEAQVGIIAACIPCLRAVFLRLLSRMGIYTESSRRVDSASSTWSDQGRPAGGSKSSGFARFRNSSTSRGALGDPQTLTDTVVNQSEEESMHSRGLPGPAVCKNHSDIELFSVTGT